MSDCYVLDGHTPVEEPDLMTWAKWLEDADLRVAFTKVSPPVTVSTAFLGLDYNFAHEGPPLVFETMISGGPLDNEQRQYATWDEAEAGHAELVRAAEEAK